MSTSPYSPAARILNEIWTKRKGLKTIVYSQNGELKCSKTTYAQCSQVLKHYPLLKQLLQDDNNNSKEDGITLAVAPHNQGLLYVLLYELLLGPNKAVKGGGSLKRALLQQHKALQSKLQKLQQQQEQQYQDDDDDTTSTKTNTRTTIPRYVRINTLKTTTERVVQELRQRLRRSDDENENDNRAAAKIYMDPHVPDLIVMEHTPQTRRLLQPLVETQKVILQDKSSCFSALCLVHGYSDNGSDTICTGTGSNTGTSIGGHYLDACAAPGNKTSHLAALIAKASAGSQSTTTTTTTTTAKKKKMKQKTKTIIHALDQSPDRYKLLQRRMTELTTSETEPVLVECMCQDFLKTTQDQFHNQHNNNNSLHGILLDPSCSGSGMTTNHLERPNQKPDFVNDRVRKLSRFQFQALYHALTAFPTVEKVVYSTCSVYQHENERVVALALQKVRRRRGKDDDDDWELVAPKCLESWHRRGIPYHSTAGTKRDDDEDEDDEREETLVRLSKDQARCLIRVHPDQDGTNGFFVACFQKKKQSIHKESAKDWKKPELPSGMEYYNGQFFQKETTNQPQLLESNSTASSQTTTKKRSSSTAAITEDEKNKVSQSQQQKKPKMVGDDTKMNKKRAKRMEWKRKQREQKAARLQKRKLQKQNRQSVTTTP